MCANFGPDLDEFVSSWDDLAQHALIGINRSDGREIGAFLDDLLGGNHDDEALRRFWWSMPVVTTFEGSDVRRLLTSIRQALSRAPYLAPA
jgi:hypothetical protein